MRLFCVATRRYSVSCLRFTFLSHVQVFSCKISLVCYLKYNCFSSRFCFLVIFVQLMLVLVLVAEISLTLHFLCSIRVVVSMHRCYLQSWRLLFLLLSLTHSEFLTPELAGSLSIVSKRQNVFSGLQDIPLYSDWSLKFWTASIHLPIFNNFSSLWKYLETVLKALVLLLHLQGIFFRFSCVFFFFFFFFFCFYSLILLSYPLGRQSPRDGKFSSFFFFCNHH